MGHKALIVMAGVLLLLLAPAPAAACDCTFKPLSNAVRADYPFIFEGKVVERRFLHPMLTESGIGSGNTQSVDRVVFDVKRAWNGVTTKRMTVSSVVSDCMFGFELDHTYVVFAWRDEKGQPTTLHCSPTVESSQAAKVLVHLGQATVPK
jgi:hypothetical protein